MAIEIKADDGRDKDVPESEDIKLVEVDYEFVFPKVGAILAKLRRAASESKTDEEKGERYYNLQMDWLERGFGPEQWDDINDRLEDEDDPIEEAHLMEAFKLLMRAASGRPTTSSNASSRRRPASKPKAARSRKASASETSTPENSAA